MVFSKHAGCGFLTFGMVFEIYPPSTLKFSELFPFSNGLFSRAIPCIAIKKGKYLSSTISQHANVCYIF